MNRLVQLAWSIRRWLIGVLRIRTRGVKIMLFNAEGELLLIRNNYGNRQLHVLPGGGVGFREEPSQAAARELVEEVGVRAAELRFLGEFQSEAEGKRDSISLYRGTSTEALKPDPVEIAEAAFHPLDRLPRTTSAATLRRVAELRAGGPFGGRW